ncbi:MAG TPA: vitamin K epoxide reductase family protein, partial [Anaerolineales bacterium]
NDPAGNTLAVIVLVVMIVSVIWLGYSFLRETSAPTTPARRPEWLLPLLSVIGLGIALYLTFVEVTQTSAICGPIGNCNAVQRSPYARLFGVLPVGILGAAGYIAILAAWLVGYLGRRNGRQTWERFSALAVWAMVWFGMLFTIYLTFLEPFVIGSTCIWCLSSAIVMTLLLWITTGPAKEAFFTEDPLLLEDEAE